MHCRIKTLFFVCRPSSPSSPLHSSELAQVNDMLHCTNVVALHYPLHEQKCYIKRDELCLVCWFRCTPGYKRLMLTLLLQGCFILLIDTTLSLHPPLAPPLLPFLLLPCTSHPFLPLIPIFPPLPLSLPPPLLSSPSPSLPHLLSPFLHRAAAILAGLGFSPEMQSRPTRYKQWIHSNSNHNEHDFTSCLCWTGSSLGVGECDWHWQRHCLPSMSTSSVYFTGKECHCYCKQPTMKTTYYAKFKYFISTFASAFQVNLIVLLVLVAWRTKWVIVPLPIHASSSPQFNPNSLS